VCSSDLFDIDDDGNYDYPNMNPAYHTYYIAGKFTIKVRVNGGDTAVCLTEVDSKNFVEVKDPTDDGGGEVAP